MQRISTKKLTALLLTTAMPFATTAGAQDASGVIELEEIRVEAADAQTLLGNDEITEDEIEALNEAVRKDAEAAVTYALEARYPDESEVDMHVFTDVKHALA